MYYLKQSTASQEVLLGPFVSSADGFTAQTGLTIANTDIKIHKAGATTLASKNSGGATHISNGNYYATFDATDTDTLGSGTIVVQMSGALPVRVPFTVLAANVFDALIGGGDLLDVSTVQIEGGDATDALLAGVNAAMNATLADSIPADGTRPSAFQALYMAIQFLIEASVSGTTMTVKKVDGSTTLFTLTLDDATSPTSKTRAT